ncbi:MAG TPA: putative quinol monooxygenase [Candidatus Sulfotelmatobacter sp.]|nr:putative quinol monooxygenase [Candidatus Sulfotelmatobacter sp.]
MYVVVVTIDIKAGFKDRFVPAILENARSSVSREPGCFRFDVIQDEKDSNRIYLYEVYRDRAAFDAHCTMPHYFAWRDAVKDWLAAPPVLGCGPNVFPADGDWERRWKAR